MAQNDGTKPVKTITYYPDNKTGTTWFENLELQPKSKAKDKSVWQERHDALEPLRRMRVTEAELLARGIDASGQPTGDFVRDALIAHAKSHIIHYKVKTTSSGARETDKKYLHVYRELKKDGVNNITPAKLADRAETRNYRSAKRWLERHGYSWVSQRDPRHKEAKAAADAATAPAPRKSVTKRATAKRSTRKKARA